MPLTQDPVDLHGVDVAIVGAPTDDLVSDRPGTRFAPRAIRAASCPPGPQLETRVDAMAELRVVDFGDAPVLPADPVRSHAAIEATVGQVLAAGPIPVVIGGDHSISEPNVRACAAAHGPVGLVHFDTHTDTGTEVFGVELSHGTIMRRLVEDGHVDPGRYAQIGLRGYWPGKRGVRLAGRTGHNEPLHARDPGPRHQGGHRQGDGGGRPRPRLPDGGHRRARSGLRAGHRDARAGRDEHRGAVVGGAGGGEWLSSVVGADLVEVIPTGVGSADITALAADRIVREILGGIALRRRRQPDEQTTKEER